MKIIPAAEISIIGGGPAGSGLAILLRQLGIRVALFEKKKFPREVLCGEFLSHEVTEFISRVGLRESFLKLIPNPVKRFTLTAPSRVFSSELSFTGYGLSRGAFDKLLLDYAKELGADIYEEHEVIGLYKAAAGTQLTGKYREGEFTCTANYIISAYGKQNILDKSLKRKHSHVNSGFFGVKYHIPASALSGFKKEDIIISAADNIYCGVNCIEQDRASLCFLAKTGKHISDRASALRYLSSQNSHFAALIERAGLMEASEPKVYGTGNIYFGTRNLTDTHTIYSGDAAAVIPPLAGDGIGMALENAGLLSALLKKLLNGEIDTLQFEDEYASGFNNRFAKRLRTAGIVQRVLFSKYLRAPGIAILNMIPELYPFIEKNTRQN